VKPLPPRLVAALGLPLGLGLGAVVTGAATLVRQHPRDGLDVWLPALVGLAFAGLSARWLVACASVTTERTLRGARRPAAYAAWGLWTCVFLAVCVRMGRQEGLSFGLALGAVTAWVGASNLDLLPRLLVSREGLGAPGRVLIVFAELESFEIVEGAASGMVCLRLLRRGAERTTDEWLDVSEVAALRRLFAARGVKDRPVRSGAPRLPSL
jgi:hypothetical protein